MAAEKVEEEFKELVELDKEMSTKSNADRRNIYARGQLLVMDIEDSSKDGILSPESLEKIEKLEAISKNSKLVRIRVKRNNGLVHFFDTITGTIRTTAVVIFLFISGIVVALPCVMLRPMEYVLLRMGLMTPHNRLAVMTKKLIGGTILLLAGVEVIPEGLQVDKFGKELSILCFSHASTLDAFIIGLVVPVFHHTLSKAELFLIPFFSLLLLAFGGIPINRKDRDQAVQAISSAASTAFYGDCVCVSPEGTRSLTGHILPFKKGPFYMWEQLKAPIVPAVFVGAYDLYPPGKTIPYSGKVYMKFLTPIAPTEAASRGDMSRLLRRRMLEAWKEPSDDAAKPVSWPFYFKHVFAVFSLYAACYYVPIYFQFQERFSYYGINAWQAFGLYLIASIAITLAFYVYLLYIDRFLSKIWKMVSGGNRNKSK